MNASSESFGTRNAFPILIPSSSPIRMRFLTFVGPSAVCSQTSVTGYKSRSPNFIS